MTSLWSGLSPTLVLAVPTTVIYFTTYEQTKFRLVKKWPHVESSYLSLTAGGLARVFAVVTVSPLELIRTKMQSQKMAFTQVRTALAVTIKSEGIQGKLP